MKNLIFIWILLGGASSAWATRNLNPLSCIYFHTENGWTLYGWQASFVKFDLSAGESKSLVGSWTDGQVAPNFGICKMITGTTDDNLVHITTFNYQASEIKKINPDCSASGSDIILLDKRTFSVNRGNYAEIESQWHVAPSPDKIKVRTYIPTLDEVDQMDTILESKCLALMP